MKRTTLARICFYFSAFLTVLCASMADAGDTVAAAVITLVFLWLSGEPPNKKPPRNPWDPSMPA